MYDIALICSTVHERQRLLERSLYTWAHDARQSGLDVAIRVYGDGCGPRSVSTETHTAGLDFETHVEFAPSGSHVTGYNHFHERTDARVYLFTHPEVMFPLGTIRAAYEAAQSGAFVAFKVFWMPEGLTGDLDRIGYDDVAAFEQHPDLYFRDPREHGECYFNADIRGITRWDSTTTYAVNAPTSRLIYPLPAFDTWGPDDPYVMNVLRNVGIANHTVMDPVLFHQWHPHGPIDLNRVNALARDAIRARR